MTVLCVIPAKGHSRRLPGKNLRPVAGIPLVVRSVQQALESSQFEAVVVSTDSDEIAARSREAGALVPQLRPLEDSGPEVHAAVPVLHTLEQLGGARRFEYCSMLLPTSPLRDASSIAAVVDWSRRERRNVVSVVPLGKNLLHLRTRDAEGRLHCVTSEVPKNFQTNAAPLLYGLNGSIYCAPSRELLRHRSFHYGEPLGFVMDPLRSIDIDTGVDLELAEFAAAFLAERKADRAEVNP